MVIKILMKENHAPFIIMEEQLLPAFTSEDLHGKTSQSLHCVCVLRCNNSEVRLESKGLTIISLPELEEIQPRGDWELGSSPGRSHFQMFSPLTSSSLSLAPPEERRGLQQRGEIFSPCYLNSVILLYTPKVHWVSFAKCHTDTFYFSNDSLEPPCAVSSRKMES